MYGRIHRDWHTDERLGCIRSLACQWSRATPPGKNPSAWVCGDCRVVPTYRSFKRQLRRTSVVSSRTNDQYLSRIQLLALRSTSTNRSQMLRRRVTRLAIQLAQARLRLRNARDQLRVDIERGDVAAVSHRLRALHREGAFQTAAPQLRIAMDGLTALCAPERGARRSPVTKELMQVLQIEFGPACARFVHANLGLGGGTSVERWLRTDRRSFRMGIDEENFREAAEVMAAMMARLGITGPIMHQM
jgi:hypothetical protein